MRLCAFYHRCHLSACLPACHLSCVRVIRLVYQISDLRFVFTFCIGQCAHAQYSSSNFSNSISALNNVAELQTLGHYQYTRVYTLHTKYSYILHTSSCDCDRLACLSMHNVKIVFWHVLECHDLLASTSGYNLVT